MNFNLKARLVAAIAQFKAHHDIRYYLNGILLEPDPAGGAFIVATNGHALGVWRDATATGLDRRIIVAVDDSLVKACHGSDLKRLVVRDNRLAVVMDTDKGESELYIQPVEAKKKGCPHFEVEGIFPDWVKVVPRPASPGIKGGINPAYIHLVERANQIGATSGSKFCSLVFDQKDADSPILVQSGAPDALDFLAVIMPMRGDSPAFPKWMADKKDAWDVAHTVSKELQATAAAPGAQATGKDLNADSLGSPL